MDPPVIFIIGCTGSGKGGLGRELARRVGGEIISVDSMKIYRRMDIGTAKPSKAVRSEVPHHLIDIVEPSQEFSVAQFVDTADRARADIKGRGRPVLAVGGTALYVKALSEGLFEGPGADPDVRARIHEFAQSQGQDALYARLQSVDPTAAERIHSNDLRRIVRALEVFELTGKPISSLQEQWDQRGPRFACTFLGVRREKEDQNQRTNLRVKKMIEGGLVEEVEKLLAEPEPLSETARQAVGYAEIIRHLKGEISLADAIELIKINTRRLAKSQRTWFKRFLQTEWIDVGPDDSAPAVAEAILRRKDAAWKP